MEYEDLFQDEDFPTYDFPDRELFPAEVRRLNRLLRENFGATRPVFGTLYDVLFFWDSLTNHQSDADELIGEYEAIIGFPLDYPTAPPLVTPPDSPVSGGRLRGGSSCPLFRC
jgi:hypothetical protein